MSMAESLEAIQHEVEQGLAHASSPEEIEAIRVQVLGKKGSLTAVMHMMGSVSKWNKPDWNGMEWRGMEWNGMLRKRLLRLRASLI